MSARAWRGRKGPDADRLKRAKALDKAWRRAQANPGVMVYVGYGNHIKAIIVDELAVYALDGILTG